MFIAYADCSDTDMCAHSARPQARPCVHTALPSHVGILPQIMLPPLVIQTDHDTRCSARTLQASHSKKQHKRHAMSRASSSCHADGRRVDHRKVHPNRSAPRCLPCGYQDPLHKPNGTSANVPLGSYRAPEVCNLLLQLSHFNSLSSSLAHICI